MVNGYAKHLHSCRLLYRLGIVFIDRVDKVFMMKGIKAI